MGKELALVGVLAILMPVWAEETEHCVAMDKKLKPQWVDELFAKGQRKVYCGKELETIGMPCGGICAGQIYVRGDGTLAHWWIANDAHNTGYGSIMEITTPLGRYKQGYQTYRPFSPIEQGFAIRVKPEDGPVLLRKLNRDGFDGIRFIGEFPIATIDYCANDETPLPVEIRCEVFSPFIPLNVRDSSIPVTIIQYTIKNTLNEPVEVSIAGWLQNAVCLELKDKVAAQSRNRVIKHKGLTSIHFDVIQGEQEIQQRRMIIFEDFEDGSYKKWSIQGEAFAARPATGTLKNQQQVSGFNGKYLVNSFRGGSDRLQGKLTSKPFKITEPYIAFLIGGGNHPGKTCMNLVVEFEKVRKVVRSATGKNDERLEIAYWNVEEFMGRRGYLEIVDRESGGWGHINIDHIYFTNLPPNWLGKIAADHPQLGDMTLTVLDTDATACPACPSEQTFLADLADDGRLSEVKEQLYPLGERRCGVLASSSVLKEGETKEVVFLISWYFPNRRQSNKGVKWGEKSGVGQLVGNMYANWFDSSLEVAEYVAENFQRLRDDTFLFRDTYFDTTLPYWFVHRIGMPLANLATETCQWWKNGRFWGWEGVGCCHGTCGHVWNYAQGLARLFPELERSVREMQDFNPQAGFVTDSGMIRFRGEGWGAWAGDSQAGYILKVYREHLISPDDEFLKRNWTNIRKALEFLIKEDGNADGLLEGRQHNTYDIDFYGANTMVGSLYLAALRAGEEMAKRMGDEQFARRCRQISESGRRLTMERLWNGEYFIQEVDLTKYPKHQYGQGCLSDQLFGQGWAHQLGLGYIYPPEKVKKALQSIWKYNWAADVGPYNAVYKPGRLFASPGEAGLFTCTWPKGGRPKEPMLYKNEVWTGIEYQVASHMLYEGMVKEALAIVRGIHERYDGVKHNPWNEIECGDHYARALASWGCLLGIEGYIYDGPAGKIGFGPRLSPEDFKGFFTAAQAWGSLVQKRNSNTQINRIEVKWGRLRIKTLVFELPNGIKLAEAAVYADGRLVDADAKQQDNQVIIVLTSEIIVNKGQAIKVVLSW